MNVWNLFVVFLLLIFLFAIYIKGNLRVERTFHDVRKFFFSFSLVDFSFPQEFLRLLIFFFSSFPFKCWRHLFCHTIYHEISISNATKMCRDCHSRHLSLMFFLVFLFLRKTVIKSFQTDSFCRLNDPFLPL